MVGQKVLLFILFCVYMFKGTVGIYLESPISGEQVCVGTGSGFSKMGDSSYHYKRLYKQYVDCTYVFGNLEITHLKRGQDTSFLANIRVVTGYMLLFANEVDVPLPSLVFVRGDMRFMGYTVLIAMFNNVPMPALKEISGDLKYYNPSCFLDTIRWDLIVRGKVIKAKSSFAHRNCDDCSPECEDRDGQSHCWGPGPDMCQTVPLIECDYVCHNATCHEEGMLGCCHPQCVGGCTDGWINSACDYCRNFKYQGRCIQDCPETSYYIGEDCIDLD
ncbi:receptor tyrosine-protein kinase erbB-3-like [Mya arenaria]|uniref:receptor tyrosine-protein kinase erbB-3-like n=1 Tax=Mya arenaria TaxID=6604 RepID=UPI0022E29043|nr:receptor tyrosine-protein kinase erbB-3-like [Mya arenaria]